jgi:hypothetical protein
VPRAQPPPWLEPSLRSCDAHSYSHEALSNLCGDQERSASRGASPLRHCDHRSRHDALQRSSGFPLCLRGGGGSSSPHFGPRRLELFGSLLARGGGVVVARVDTVARRVAEAALWVVPSDHLSTTCGLAPSTCGPGRPRVPRPLAPPPLSRSSLPLHLRQRPPHLPSLSRGSFPFRGLRPSPCGGPGLMGGTRSLLPTPPR